MPSADRTFTPAKVFAIIVDHLDPLEKIELGQILAQEGLFTGPSIGRYSTEQQQEIFVAAADLYNQAGGDSGTFAAFKQLLLGLKDLADIIEPIQQPFLDVQNALSDFEHSLREGGFTALADLVGAIRIHFVQFPIAHGIRAVVDDLELERAFAEGLLNQLTIVTQTQNEPTIVRPIDLYRSLSPPPPPQLI